VHNRTGLTHSGRLVGNLDTILCYGILSRWRVIRPGVATSALCRLYAHAEPKSACSDVKNPHIPVTQPYWRDLARAQSRDESLQFEGKGRQIADESTGICDHVQHYVLHRTTKRNSGVGLVSEQKRGSIVELS
jgi:hypothetical protein